MKTTSKHATLPIITRNGRHYLRKTFEGKQREFPLGKDLKVAESRCKRFLATFSSTGLDAAVLELNGKKVIKAGCNPTHEEMAELYRDFCSQSAKSPTLRTIDHNVSCLKLIMNRAGVSTVAMIDKNTLFKKWFKDTPNPTTSNKRTFSANVRAAKSIFKTSALAYYKTRNIPLENPFKGMELVTPTIQQYVPISKEVRESIWKDCQTELNPHDAMIVLLALGAGMRRTEIESMKMNWLTVQKESVTITIKEDGEFRPKVNETGVVSIPVQLYELLLKLRGENESEFVVPADSRLSARGRIQKRMRAINSWLKSKGITESKALHALRKEYGSFIAKTQSILAASKSLRNTVAVCGIYYAGIADVDLVDIQESFNDKKDPFQAVADQLGISLEDLKKKLSA
jgi:integrase